MHKKSQLAAVVTHREQLKKPLLIVEASLKSDILTLTKEAIVLMCDSTGRSEILG